MKNSRQRQIWSVLHRWTALTLGTLLAFTALLGALLTVARPLDQHLHPELFRQPAGVQAAAAPLTLVAQRLRQEFGPGASLTLRPPREPGESLWTFVRGPWAGTVYFDASGRELGRRGEHEGWCNLLFELHSELLLGETGKAVLTTAAAAYLLLLASGLVLWWPRRWPPSWRVERGAGALRATLDLHKLGGSLLGLMLAVSVATGGYMAWPPLRDLVSALAGEQAMKPPRVRPAAPGAAAVPLESLAQTAARVFPGASVGYVQVPAKPTQPVRVRLKTADDPHPNGLSFVWLHPATGEVLGSQRWDRLDAGHRIVTIVYPLHAGTLGGLPHTVFTGLSGLALAGLGVTGLAVWWQRRTRRRAVVARATA